MSGHSKNVSEHSKSMSGNSNAREDGQGVFLDAFDNSDMAKGMADGRCPQNVRRK
jgi:hypothetical protein